MLHSLPEAPVPPPTLTSSQIGFLSSSLGVPHKAGCRCCAVLGIGSPRQPLPLVLHSLVAEGFSVQPGLLRCGQPLRHLRPLTQLQCNEPEACACFSLRPNRSHLQSLGAALGAQISAQSTTVSITAAAVSFFGSDGNSCKTPLGASRFLMHCKAPYTAQALSVCRISSC